MHRKRTREVGISDEAELRRDNKPMKRTMLRLAGGTAAFASRGEVGRLYNKTSGVRDRNRKNSWTGHMMEPNAKEVAQEREEQAILEGDSPGQTAGGRDSDFFPRVWRSSVLFSTKWAGQSGVVAL